MTLAFKCSGLEIGWPDKETLAEGIELKLDPMPACLPIVGQTGSGKSTLLYVMGAMALQKGGSVSWQLPGRTEAMTWDHREKGGFQHTGALRRQAFGFVLQDADLIGCFSVKENIEHALRLRASTAGQTKSQEDIAKNAKDFMTEKEKEGSGPAELLAKFPSELSGGTRKRMAIAAAVAHDPQVLFADEPTSGLDDPTGITVLSRIRKWLEKPGFKGKRSFVCVTHQLGLLREAFELGADADVIEVGKLVAEAKAPEQGLLVAKPEDRTQVVLSKLSVVICRQSKQFESAKKGAFEEAQMWGAGSGTGAA